MRFETRFEILAKVVEFGRRQIGFFGAFVIPANLNGIGIVLVRLEYGRLYLRKGPALEFKTAYGYG